MQEGLNRVIKQFENWFSINSLIIATAKAKAMLFHFNKTSNLVKPKIVFKNLKRSAIMKKQHLFVKEFRPV
jgi:hypothetical protein